jgi:hypothetical protein
MSNASRQQRIALAKLVIELNAQQFNEIGKDWSSPGNMRRIIADARTSVKGLTQDELSAAISQVHERCA